MWEKIALFLSTFDSTSFFLTLFYSKYLRIKHFGNYLYKIVILMKFTDFFPRKNTKIQKA